MFSLWVVLFHHWVGRMGTEVCLANVLLTPSVLFSTKVSGMGEYLLHFEPRNMDKNMLLCLDTAVFSLNYARERCYTYLKSTQNTTKKQVQV